MSLLRPLLVMLSVTLIACGSDSGSGPGTTICAEMTRAHCLQQAHCTLELTYTTDDQGERRANNGVYRCRDAEGPCELRNGLTCQEVEGCTMVTGECYCGCRGGGRTSVPDGDEAAECDCACGGEEPPRCIEAAP